MDIKQALPIARMTPPPRWLAEAWADSPAVCQTEIDTTTIRYRSWGLDRRDLPGMVLVHGFRAHARWWDHIAPFLAQDHRVVALDLNGMGDSGRRPVYSRRGFAGDILGVIDHAVFDWPVIVAHSFGGVAAWLACIVAPERIGRAILVDSIMEIFEASSERLSIMARPQRIYRTKDDAMSRFRLLPPGEWPDPHILAYIAEHSLAPCAEGWTWKFDPRIAEDMNVDEWGALHGVMVPVDYIYADRSEILPLDRVEAILRHLPNCDRAVAIPASDHHILIEQPLALVAAIRALLVHPHPAA